MTEKVGYTIKELAAQGPLSERAIRQAIHDFAESAAGGHQTDGLRAVKHGRLTLVLAEDWRNYLAQLPQITVRDLQRWAVKQTMSHEGVAV